MKIKEILEKSYETKMDDIAKELPVGEKRVRAILKNIGCEPNGVGKKGWTYTGSDPTILEKDFEEFIPHTADGRKTSQQGNKQDKKQPKKTATHDIIKEENKPTRTLEIRKANQELKKVTYEIEEWLHDELKIKSVREKRKVSEIVNEMIKRGLEE